MYSCCGESLDMVTSSKSRLRTSSVVVAMRWSTASNYVENIQRQRWTRVGQRVDDTLSPVRRDATGYPVTRRTHVRLVSDSHNDEPPSLRQMLAHNRLSAGAAAASVECCADHTQSWHLWRPQLQQRGIFRPLLPSPAILRCVVATASTTATLLWDVHAEETPTDMHAIRQRGWQTDASTNVRIDWVNGAHIWWRVALSPREAAPK